MNVYLTFDYEIYFGRDHGTAQKNLIEPTRNLMEVAEKTGARFTFFIDCGYLLKLKEYTQKFPDLEREYLTVSDQIRKLVSQGHACELHIHPHWEKTTFDGKCWNFDYQFYKLSDFPQDQAAEIINKYIDELESITRKKATVFRAGGWCAQPFSMFRDSFLNRGINIDSSVFKGGKNVEGYYYYDYTTAPEKDSWRFEEKVCEEVAGGNFTELPISSYHYSPLFFWKLFILGRLFPKQHKPIGDGKPMPSSLTRQKMLTQRQFLSGNVDGFFVTKAATILRRNLKKGYKHTVFLGHPKATTHFALRKMERLLVKYRDQCFFVAMNENSMEQ